MPRPDPHPPLLPDPPLPEPPPALARLLPPGTVAPAYGRASVAEVPVHAGRLLGVEAGWVGTGLEPGLLPDDPARRVILLCLDGLGWDGLRGRLAAGDEAISSLLERRLRAAARLTSVAPATTSVATTALLGDGSDPAATGQLGYTYRLPALGMVANMLFWTPAGRPGAASGELEGWGLRPESFLPTRSLAQVLEGAGVPMTGFLPAAYVRSPLSRMQLRGARAVGTLGLEEMMHALERWAEDTADARALAWAYHPDLDALAHRDGADAPGWARLLEAAALAIERFLARLSPRARRGLTLLVVADHGHVVTPPARALPLPELPADAWALRPGGEARHAYLHPRPGALEEAAATLREAWGDQAVLLRGPEALAAGLYGDPARAHPEAAARLGDLIAIPRGDRHFRDGPPLPMLGMHGGLEREEMLVPLLRFDAEAPPRD